MGLLNISRETKIQTISKTWKKLLPIVMEKYGKTQRLQS